MVFCQFICHLQFVNSEVPSPHSHGSSLTNFKKYAGHIFYLIDLIIVDFLVGRRQSIAGLIVCEVVNYFSKTSSLQPAETGRVRRLAELAGDKSPGNGSRAVLSFPPRVKTSRAASGRPLPRTFSDPLRLFWRTRAAGSDDCFLRVT